MTVALADCPSLVAVMVAEPAATPVTRPPPSTLATLGRSLVHVTVRSPRGSWLASSGIAVSCAAPGSTMVSRRGDTDTEATGGGSTVMVAMPDAPPALAASGARGKCERNNGDAAGEDAGDMRGDGHISCAS